MLSGFHVVQKILLRRMMQKQTNSWAILQVLQLTKFDYRLSSNLDDELQKLRCRVNYHALKFTKSINELGQKLVMRMRQMAKRFVAVHLRFVCHCLLIGLIAFKFNLLLTCLEHRHSLKSILFQLRSTLHNLTFFFGDV